MMTQSKKFDRCPTCGKYAFLPHQCPPKWRVRLLKTNLGERDEHEYSEAEYSFIDVFAISAQVAAESFARQFDSDTDYDIASETMEVEVIVGDWCLPEDVPENQQVFKVSGYTQPVYNAELVRVYEGCNNACDT